MAGKILGKLKGLISSARESSRNGGRKYTENFWDGIYNSDMFIEGLENKMFFGELWHPEHEEEYGEIHPDDRAAVVLTKVEKKGLDYFGEFDILPTRAGEVLRNLIDIGCIFGISSRGYSDCGDLSVFDDPSSFNLITYDVVAFPGLKSARLHLVDNIAESFNRKMNKAKIMENLNNVARENNKLGKYTKNVLKTKEDFDDTVHIEELIDDEDLVDYITIIETDSQGKAFYDGEHGRAPISYILGDELKPNTKYLVEDVFYNETYDTYDVIDIIEL